MADSTTTLRITNKAHEGYRRAGVPFAKGPNDIPATAFNQSQLAMLEADPRLEVIVLDDVQAAEADPEEGALVADRVGDELNDAPDGKTQAIDPQLQAGLDKLLALVGADELELNSSGKPNADALGVNAAQRNAIWSHYLAQQDNG